MPLAPLGQKAAGKLVRAVLGDLPPEKAAWIIERADGNPFYLEELLRGVSNGMEVGEGASVPQTVLGMVQARFDALGADAKKVLRAASVFGQTFRAGGVRALVSGRDEDRTIDDWLEILAAKEVVFARAAGETCEFVFRHALVRDAAYEMIPDRDRPAGHKLAGEYLEKAGERDANVLVEHFERGGELPKAAYWSQFAAEQALEANDLREVIRRVERGVRCGAEGEVLGYLKVAEAEARYWRGEYLNCELVALESLEAGGPKTFIKLRTTYWLLDPQGFMLCDAGEHAKAISFFGRALGCFESVGASRAVAHMRVNLAATLDSLGRAYEAMQHLDILLTAVREHELNALLPPTYVNMAAACLNLGCIEAARLCTDRAVAIAAGQNDPQVRGQGAIYEARTCLASGSLSDAESAARSAVAYFEHWPSLQNLGIALLAAAKLAQGQLAEAHELASKANAFVDQRGSVDEGEALIRLLYARTLDAMGRHDEARSVITAERSRLLRVASALPEPAWRASFLYGVAEHAEVLALATQWDSAA